MITISATYFLFLNNLDSFLEDELKLSYDQTINLSIILPFTLMVCVPSISFLVDRVGNKAFYFLIASVLGIGALISTKYEIQGKIGAALFLFSFGFFYSWYGAMIWSAGSQSCPPDIVDLGLATMNTI